jgi:hypothetical protein
LEHLEEVTAEFGKLIRKFRDDFSRHQTVELLSEANKRVRASSAAQNGGPGISDEARQEARECKLNAPSEGCQHLYLQVPQSR